MDLSDQEAVPVTVWTGGVFGTSLGIRAIQGGSAGLVSTAWGTANLAFYCPIFLPFRYPVRNLFAMNAATVAGNVDIGIYNDELRLLVSSGSTAMAGVSTMQFFPVDIVLDPGQYYLGYAMSSTTATVFASLGGGTALAQRLEGLLQQATALPLPAAATPATIAANRMPAIGCTYRSGTPTF